MRWWQIRKRDADLERELNSDLELEEEEQRERGLSPEEARRAALPLRLAGARLPDYQADVAELLNWVGLGERMWALPPVLSGGEKQRAAIARAVIARPQLLLADEPTGNVDPSLAQRLLRLFVELNKSGTSVVIATHDIALMDQYDARRLVLHEGRLHVYD